MTILTLIYFFLLFGWAFDFYIFLIYTIMRRSSDKWKYDQLYEDEIGRTGSADVPGGGL